MSVVIRVPGADAGVMAPFFTSRKGDGCIAAGGAATSEECGISRFRELKAVATPPPTTAPTAKQAAWIIVELGIAKPSSDNLLASMRRVSTKFT